MLRKTVRTSSITCLGCCVPR